MKKLKSKIFQFWGNLDVRKQNWLIVKTNSILNYLISAIIFSIPIYLILYLKYSLELYNYFYIILIMWTLLPLIEHYYIWFKEDWKKEVWE